MKKLGRGLGDPVEWEGWLWWVSGCSEERGSLGWSGRESVRRWVRGT